MANAPEATWSGVEGFPEPLDFLNGFQDGDTPYHGLYGFLSVQLDVGKEAEVRAFVGSASLGMRDQAAHADLLATMLEMRNAETEKPRYESFYPTIEAAINYLKYRLALSVMTPAVDIALERTLPEHTNARRRQVLTAVNVVKAWVDRECVDATKAQRVTSYLESNISSYLRGYLNQELRATESWNIDPYLAGGYWLPEVGRDSDRYRLFDLKDFSFRVTHAQNGVLPTADEVEEIKNRERRAQRQARINQTNPTGRSPVPRETVKDITRQVMGWAFGDLDVITPEAAATLNGYRPTPSPETPWRDLQPATRVAAMVASRLLRHLEDHVIAKWDQPGSREFDRKSSEKAKVIARLREVLDQGTPPWELVDNLLEDMEEAYIARYGDMPVHRDFWDSYS